MTAIDWTGLTDWRSREDHTLGPWAMRSAHSLSLIHI